MIKTIKTTRYVDDETRQEYHFEPIEETIELKQIEDGYELRYLTQDDGSESPDMYGDNSLFLVHYHRDFQVENDLCPKNVLGYIYTENDAEYDKEGAEELLKTHYCFPVDAYIHSGITLSMSGGFHGRLSQGHERFDVSHVGAVLVNKTEFKDKEEAEKAALSLLQSWNEYLSGDVYCLVCEKLDKDKQQIDFDIVGGYSGLDYAKKCLKTEI